MNVTSRDRRIRRLRFACQREEQAWRGRTLLEDALRTASLGDDGRVVVIRSLALGRLSPQASAMTWSMRLERCVQAAQAGAVFAGSAAAADAEAVWFPSEIEVWVSLAARGARGAPYREWFWAPAAPGWNPRLSATETLRLAFHRLVAAGRLPATFALARRLAHEGSLRALLRAVSVEDVQALVAGLHEAAPSSDLWDETAALAASILPDAWRKIVAEFSVEVPLGDARLTWLAAAAFFSETSILPTVGEVQRVVRGVRQCSSQPADTVPTSPLVATGRTAAAPPETETPAHPASAPDPEGVVTDCGGLFFLVPLFARLGIADLPDAEAAAWQALRLVLRRCQRRPGDDLRRLLPAAESRAPAAFVLPRLLTAAQPLHLARWRRNWRVLLDPTGRLPLAAWPRGTPSPAPDLWRHRPVRRAPDFPQNHDPLVAALLLGAHRLCRRQSGLGLKTLVRRPASIAVSDTHVDVFFRFSAADVRIRRAALDVDPGWVRWLGRVVTFHYPSND